MGRTITAVLLFAVLLFLELTVIPHFTLYAPPLAMVFFIIRMYRMDAIAGAYYALVSGALYAILHGVSFSSLPIFAALAAAAWLFRQVLTHRGPLHFFVFLGLELVVWQAADIVRIAAAEGLDQLFSIATSSVRFVDVAFSLTIFFFVAAHMFAREFFGVQRTSLGE
ncbi:MAG: hypothetical protein A3I44_04300 [Candidatus Sungbacteria bacterium RIFCSPLOWO2_02_FULL_51_17]|uniref:Rod shape-determining protein MreD n=1 Tax=Candidatus Sungbacteria bacterium RIFCSPHIGHO2_02_FULL_51_29 TaxID=1802273 RepID=A0A1G2KYX5_9BACT|nr:MAG: hypothetical protein A2676_02810 [Candidatus Sungbacteria bacterium RIFCSPHIGHO2_01_FULL_51_22]OHA03681.1 MAG: hypothetical protein A3C16_03530 [Candidatus Sungbacteria bacterium RIFCSPHIGHO2_02_FULL_51_29]OHA07335.1 MAG: hypothetical protein A3B29_02905 [Candidatus Sungbacteria bacterium RIFCSPLOWO2_01_FULL_51_34]OHA11298.1 MAG: hypothetical protein A3I44_04300 [Candidatus Sungbacteria bacterium RIFCSPLOWO2_02_FULL_51_17]